MKKIAVIDLQEQKFSTYVLNGNDYSLLSSHSVSFEQKHDYSFIFPEDLKALDETYLSIPLSLLNFRIIELPFTEKKKVLELVPFELDGIIMAGSESIIFDTFLIGNENGRSKVLVAYIRKEILSVILTNVRSQGLDPRAVLSLEVGHLVAHASADDFARKIVAPVSLSEKERICRAVKELQNPVVDFRKAEFVYTADTEKVRKSLRLTAVLASLIIFLFITHSTVNIVYSSKQNQAVKDEIRKAYQAIFPEEKRITSERYQLTAHLKELQDKENSFLGTSPLQVLLALTKISGPGVSLNEITVDKEIVILKGECPSLSDVQKIKNRLDEFLTGSSITDTKPSTGNKMLFTITAKGTKT
jgi:type II secretory pathway component PulL